MGRDPIRHGRFTAIANRGIMAFIKIKQGCFVCYNHFSESVPDTMIFMRLWLWFVRKIFEEMP